MQPSAQGPSAAEVLAAQRAAARAKAARQKAERLKKQRRAARRQRAAARRAAEARKREAARRDARAQRLRRTARESGGANETVGEAVPILATATIAALLIFGLALVPAYAVPWHRMSIALEVHREQFALVGAMTLLAAAAVFLSLTFLGH